MRSAHLISTLCMQAEDNLKNMAELRTASEQGVRVTEPEEAKALGARIRIRVPEGG